MNEKYKTFTVLMAKINRSIRKIKTEEMAEFNLKSPHVSCLYYLYKSENLTAKDVFDAAKAGDAVAKELVDELGEILGSTLSNIAFNSRSVIFYPLTI